MNSHKALGNEWNMNEYTVEQMSYMLQVEAAAQYVKEQLGDSLQPTVGLILGSGLGDLGDEVEQALQIAYEDIPYFPVSTVEGHQGRFVVGRLEGKCVMVMQGRFHYYEGYPQKRVVFPIYVMKQLGIQALVITNAAGGMNRSYQAGDLMIIRDHINLTGDNPLIGPNEDKLGVRFPDMSQAYDRDYGDLALRLFEEIRAQDGAVNAEGAEDVMDTENYVEADEASPLREGVYCGISGPTYMTPAELTMLSTLGGDAVGMSTVGEVIAARHCGLRVLGISCITDMAIGEALEPLTHEQVVAVANRTKPKFIELIRSFIRTMSLT